MLYAEDQANARRRREQEDHEERPVQIESKKTVSSDPLPIRPSVERDF
jgi:hypothetical protein